MPSVMRKESIANLCVSGRCCMFILVIWVVTEHPLLLVFSLSMKFQLAIVAYAYNPNAWEAEAGRLRFKNFKSAWATEWEPVSKTKTLDQQQSQTQHCYGKRFLLLFIYCSGGWIQCLGRPSWLFDCIQSLQGQSFAGTVTNWYRAFPECTRQTLDIMPSQFFVLEHLGSYLRPFLSSFLISLCVIFSVCAHSCACVCMHAYVNVSIQGFGLTGGCDPPRIGAGTWTQLLESTLQSF